MGRPDQFGRIEAGQLADIVIVTQPDRISSATTTQSPALSCAPNQAT